MLNSNSTVPKSPEAYHKRDYANHDDEISKRMFHVDQLHVNKEKKLFFQTVNNDYDYFPFGTPGGGAPLRNQKNEPVSKLPNINDNLWRRGTSENIRSPQQSTANDVEQKKKQVLDLIEAYASNKPVSFVADGASTFNYEPRRRSRYPEHRYDPITRDHIRPERYWNDWFGKPGAGAPNYGAYKKNLNEMLEPRGGRGDEAYQSSLSVSTSLNSLIPTSSRYRSNHHNNYEIPHPDELDKN